MFTDEAAWLRRTLAGLTLPADPSVINVGSSTEHYRTVDQPHNEQEVLGPLRQRGASITHLDVKQAPGVDLVVDLADPDLDLRASAGTHDLALVTGLLQHLHPAVLENLVGQLGRILEPGGFVVLTTPESYRRTLDPADFGYRASPKELAASVCRDGLVEVLAESVRIDDPRYYKGILSRPSWIPFRGMWIPLPGATERLRFHSRRWRWRESCAVCRAPSAS